MNRLAIERCSDLGSLGQWTMTSNLFHCCIADFGDSVPLRIGQAENWDILDFGMIAVAAEAGSVRALNLFYSCWCDAVVEQKRLVVDLLALVLDQNSNL